MRRFKRQVMNEGILQEARRRVFFLKPCQKKKLKAKLAQIRRHKERRFRRANY
jgi:ribosomal protein S21